MKKNRIISLTIICAALLVASTAKAQISEKKQLVPTVTIPAPPGSKGFGMPQAPKPGTASGTTPAAPPRRRGGSASVTEPHDIKTIPIDSMSMSDPYILADDATKTYYLTGSGGGIYKSTDLKNWTGPYGAYDTRGTWMEGINFVAAAEIHKVNGKYFYAASFGDRKELVDVVPTLLVKVCGVPPILQVPPVYVVPPLLLPLAADDWRGAVPPAIDRAGTREGLATGLELCSSSCAGSLR